MKDFLNQLKQKNMLILISAIILVIIVLIIIANIINNSGKRNTTISTQQFDYSVSDEKVYKLNLFMQMFYNYRLDYNDNKEKLTNMISENLDANDLISSKDIYYIFDDVVCMKIGNIEHYIVGQYEYETADILNNVDIPISSAKKIYYNISYDTNTNSYIINDICENKDDIYKVYDITSIDANSNNTAISKEPTDEQIANILYEMYKRLLRVAPDVAWDKLDEEYRTTRFENYENFLDYVNEIKSNLDEFTMEKYRREDSKFVIQDCFENIYTFNIGQNYLDYVAFLDEYTLKNEDFYKEYESYTDEQKLGTFVGDIMLMINNKDYIQLYNRYLNARNKLNYEDLDDFKIRFFQKFPNFYTQEDVTVETLGNIYKVTLTLKDTTYEMEKEVILLIEPTDTYFSFAFSG